MSTPLITSQILGTPRNNFTGSVGFRFLAPASSLPTVTSLGRWVISGNSASHTVYLCDLGTAGTAFSIVSSVSVNTSGAPAAAYLYSSVTPYVLLASHYYALLSDEVNGGDQWYDDGGTVITLDATIGSAQVSGSNGNVPPTAFGINTFGNSYVPPNLLVSTPSTFVSQAGAFLVGP
jgi:hypothetical protein